MAHEALVSLNLLIERFLNIGYSYTHPETILVSSFYSRNRNRWNNILPPILNISESVHEQVWSLKSILELHHFKESEELNAFKGEILEAIPKFKGILEDQLNKFQLLFAESQSLDDESSAELEIISQDLQKLRNEMISFYNTMKKIIKEYNAKLDMETSNKELPLADEDFGGNAKDIVGVYDEDLRQLTDKLLPGSTVWGKHLSLSIISVVGMGGISKTTIVKAVYNKPVISDYFDTRAFIRVGPDYHLKDILLNLLICFSPNYNKKFRIENSEDELGEQIYESLKGRTYLIVLDDVWDTDFWDDIRRCIPYDNKGSKIIFTTRLFSVASNFSIIYDILKISLRNEEQSWNLFCKKVFVEDSALLDSRKLEKILSKSVEDFPLE